MDCIWLPPKEISVLHRFGGNVLCFLGSEYFEWSVISLLKRKVHQMKVRSTSFVAAGHQVVEIYM